MVCRYPVVAAQLVIENAKQKQCMCLQTPLYLLLTDVSTFYKRCNECDLWFRYQEFDEGLHNFDDKHIFTLALLGFMREYVKVNRGEASLEEKNWFNEPWK